MGTPEHVNAELCDSSRQPVQPELVRISGLALAASVLAVASLLLLPGLRWAFRKDTPESVQNLYMLILLGTSFLAGLLGIVSLAQIAASGGRLTGKGFACTGVAVPAAQVLLLLFVAFTGKTHCTAFRMTCGTNLSGIGKAMLIYANDYEDELPRSGGRNSAWGPVADWKANTRMQAFGLDAYGGGGKASISSCFYLLVKYAEVAPKSFLCKGDIGATEFKLPGSFWGAVPPGFELINAWDFGPRSESAKHCSFSYHLPFGSYALTVSSQPGFVVAADRNPWMDSPSAKARDFAGFKPDIPPFDGTQEQARQGNTAGHHGEGQSVLYLDTHVEFEKRSFCGLDDDNIYTSWDGQDKVRGVPPKLSSAPADAKDSLLVNDPISLSQ
jgi:hypothetical protein